MTRRPSQTEVRANRLIQRLNCPEIFQNDGTSNARKLYLTENKTGVSVIKDGRLYYDDPKSKRPKCYTSMTPDYSWKTDFIEVKDDISGNAWESLSRDSLNDQIRVSLFRARKCGLEELVPLTFDCLSPNEKKIATDSLSNFPRSNPQDRMYIRWEQFLSAIKSPDDNFVDVFVNIAHTQLPLKKLNLLTTQDVDRFYLLDSTKMEVWERLLEEFSSGLDCPTFISCQ